MTWLPPLVVAVPLVAAAAVVAGDHMLPSWIKDVVGVVAASAVCALGVVLMLASERSEVIHWFGGWKPDGGLAIGIDFAVGPLAAGMVVLTGAVAALTLIYARIYLEAAARLVDALMLIVCAAICGFVMTGDLFNMFVWLELMGVAGYALTGFEVSQIGPLQGAVNFAIVNTLGGYFVLIAIALLYARTGALNLAQIGHTLSGRKPDGLVIVAMTLVVCGFMCKAAVVPFHLWLADAYAVAPAPVCALFAAAMTDVGLFGVARVYWTVFDGPFAAHRADIGQALVWMGVVTALVGAAMAFMQRHLKRMLAYTVICHIGVMLAGIGLLAAKGLAGTADMLLAHGLLTGGLFLVVGVLIAALGSGDELSLQGRARPLRWLGALWFAAAIALAGPPYVGVYLGHALIDDASGARRWLPPLLWLAEAVSSGALLRAGARVFLGLGAHSDPLLSPETEEKPPPRTRATARLGTLAAVFVVAGLVVSVVPGLGARSLAGAARFEARTRYAADVLRGVSMPVAQRLPFALQHTSLESVLYGVASLVVALAVAAFGLRGVRVRGVAAPAVAGLKALHSGVVGDYVMWLTVGTALLGGVWAVTLR